MLPLLSFAACLVAVVPADEPSTAEPLLIEARIKTGTPKPYETRILDHLHDFTARGDVELDKYGGWIGERYEATGFFRTMTIDGRWWLIDPLGHRFLHLAVNSVGRGKGPQMKRAFPEKFGSASRWSERTMALLRANGFNGTGRWADDALLATASQRPVYTASMSFMGAYGNKRGGTYQLPGHKGYPNNCIFVFDPEFETFANEYARAAAQRKDDPYLLGYFSDNEMPFPRDSLDRYLQLDADDPGRKAAKKWLAERNGPTDRTKINDEDRQAWLGHVGDRYFGIVRRALRRHDPNHLYLGSRFYGSEKRSAALFRAAGKHLDVVSVNVYGVWTPTNEMLDRWADWSGRPLLMTEWYAKGDDSGMANETGAGWTVATQQQRGWFYQNFTLALIESRTSVGWHWFKYQDNDPTNPKTDPSNRNSNKGIVNVRYEPYTPLLDAMKRLNEQVYPLTEHFDRAGKEQ